MILKGYNDPEKLKISGGEGAGGGTKLTFNIGCQHKGLRWGSIGAVDGRVWGLSVRSC